MTLIHRIKKSPGLQRQSGFSLVEIMVAMVLGLLLMAGVVQIFLSSKQSYGTIMGLSQVQDSGRLSMHIIGDSVRKAGYWGSAPALRSYGSDTAVSITNYSGVFGVDEFLSGANNDVSDANIVDGTDQLILRYSGASGNPLTNCRGTEVGEDEIAIERFFIRVPEGTDTVPSLACATTVLTFDATTGDVTATGSPEMTSQPLLYGVENMQVLYGQKNATGSSLRFVSADNVTDWSAVDSVRIALLVSSAAEVSAPQRSEDIALLDETYAAPSDSRVRRIFEQTIALRNPAVASM